MEYNINLQLFINIIQHQSLGHHLLPDHTGIELFKQNDIYLLHLTWMFSQSPLQFLQAVTQGRPCFLHEQLLEVHPALHLHLTNFRSVSGAHSTFVWIGVKTPSIILHPQRSGSSVFTSKDIQTLAW